MIAYRDVCACIGLYVVMLCVAFISILFQPTTGLFILQALIHLAIVEYLVVCQYIYMYTVCASVLCSAVSGQLGY